MREKKKPNFYDNLVDLSDEYSTKKMEIWRRIGLQSKVRRDNGEKSDFGNVLYLKENHRLNENKGDNVYIIPVPDMRSITPLKSMDVNSPKLHEQKVTKNVRFCEPELIAEEHEEETENEDKNKVRKANKGDLNGSSTSDNRDESCRRSYSPPVCTVTEEINLQENQTREEEEDDQESDPELGMKNQSTVIVRLFNKFGAKLESTPGLVDAKAVSHVYRGSVLVTDMLQNKVCLYERSGKLKRSFTTRDVSEPWAATMTPDGNVAVTLRRQRSVALWSNGGQLMRVFGHNSLQCPTGIAVDKKGRIFVTDEELNDVFVFSSAGEQLFKLSDFQETSFQQPRYVCCSQSGRIVVSDSGNHCIKVFNMNGSYLFTFGSFGKGNGQFKFPYGVCADHQDNIIVADHHNHRIVMFTKNGEFVQNLVTSETGLRSPCGVTIRCSNNRKLFITHGDLHSTEVVVYDLIPFDSELTINVKTFV